MPERDVLERIAALEAQTETWQVAHDREASNRHGEIGGTLKSIFYRLESLNCGVHAERVANVERSNRGLWAAVPELGRSAQEAEASTNSPCAGCLEL